jgi:hypothetical protein
MTAIEPNWLAQKTTGNTQPRARNYVAHALSHALPMQAWSASWLPFVLY